MLYVGATLERYVVREQLGQGGAAVVYRVEHETLHTQHALKVLTVQSKGLRERLVREGRVQAQLDHPNAVTVRDVLDVDGAPALLMDFVDGPNLEDWLDEQPTDVPSLLRLFRGIVEGVRAAHEQGLIHRDLKPANVLLQATPEGLRPMVADFGLAKAIVDGSPDQGATRSGTAMGTPAYMSPEQIRDSSTVDYRADIWALGCILYTMLTRTEPFQGADIVETYNRVSSAKFEDPRTLCSSMPPSAVSLIQRCLQADQTQRLQSCDDLLQLLDAAEHEALTPGPGPATSPESSWLRPRALFVVSVALAIPSTLALLLCLGSLGTWMTGTLSLLDPEDCHRFTHGQIGWVSGPRVLLKGAGGQSRVRNSQVVYQYPPTPQAPARDPQCTLPAGTVIQMQENPQKLGTLGVWVPVHVGHFTIPNETPDDG